MKPYESKQLELIALSREVSNAPLGTPQSAVKHLFFFNTSSDDSSSDDEENKVSAPWQPIELAKK